MILEDGGLGAYSAGAALEVSPNLTLGVTGTILGGNSHRERTAQYDDPSYFEASSWITDADFHGITGSLGALLNVGSGLRMGLVLHLPEGIDADVSIDDRFASSDTTYSDAYSFTDRIDLPFRLGAGLAYARPNLILAADAIYADWTQIDYGGPLRIDDGLEAYRETVSLRLGVEVLLSTQIPLRLRAGYAYEPLPYQILLTQTEIGPFHTPTVRSARYESTVFQSDRQYLTVGAGVLLADSFTLDAAYMHGGFKRSGSESSTRIYQEEQKDRRVFVSLTMRLR
jgi:long-subunit fatty acid transport protein